MTGTEVIETFELLGTDSERKATQSMCLSERLPNRWTQPQLNDRIGLWSC